MTVVRACPECGAEVPTGRFSCGSCGALLASVEGRGVSEAPTVPPSLAPADAPAPAELPIPDDLPVPDAAGAPGTPATPPIASPPVEAVAPPLPPLPPIPGGYLSPSVVMRGAPVIAPVPARTSPVPVSARPARVPVLELPFALAPGVGPRLVAVGAVLGVAAFVLPWVTDGGVVIGGAFGSGYFATWGLAAIGNVVPFLLAWTCLVLAVLPNRVPRYVALGLLPVFLGGAFAAFGWTYVIAPSAAGIGIWVLAGGAFLLLAGGALVLRNADVAG